MGLVYKARQERLGRMVALKIIAPHLAVDEGFRERFRREAQMAAAIDHPNILPIYDAGEVDGQPYLAMRYVDGTDLFSIIGKESPLDPARVIGIAEQVAHALDAAHARGLIHRDVKPANILLDRSTSGREVVYLTDFGLTRAQTDTRLTKTGAWVGTVDYMAPEQFEAAAADGRVDQYSLACVLFEALTGTRPFPRESDLQVMFAHVRDDRPAATERRPSLPHEIDAVLRRGMATTAADRYGSCLELVGAARATLPSAPAAQSTQVDGPRVASTLVDGPAPVSGQTVTGDGSGVETAPQAARTASGTMASRTKLALAGGAVVAAGVIAAIALSGGGSKDTASTSNGATTTTSTTATTTTTATTGTADLNAFPPATALDLVAIAAKPARGAIVYTSNTPSLKGKIRVATDGSRFSLMITQAKIQMRLYTLRDVPQWVCARDLSSHRSVCRSVRKLTAQQRRDLQSTLTSYQGVMSDRGITRYFTPLALIGPKVFPDRQMEREVGCMEQRKDGDMARLCTTRDGFVTEISAISNGQRLSLRGTSLYRGVLASDFSPMSPLV